MRIMIRFPIFPILVLFLAGCTAPVSTLSRPDAYYESNRSSPTDDTLFSGDAKTLSDEAIRKILDYKYTPPTLSRIALMPFGREVWSGWSEELALASEKLQSDVLDRLRASPNIYDASYLPSILVPKNRTVPYLREAALQGRARQGASLRREERPIDLRSPDFVRQRTPRSHRLPPPRSSGCRSPG